MDIFFSFFFFFFFFETNYGVVVVSLIDCMDHYDVFSPVKKAAPKPYNFDLSWHTLPKNFNKHVECFLQKFWCYIHTKN